ncbi:MAG: phage tail protein [Candidatus Dactylopiibacterium sp.]|nr:phage tail protein [Candidatus Dactylopiibacterium sp.]
MSFGGASTPAQEPSRILSMRVSQSAYGTSIPMLRGTARVPSNLVWYGDFLAERHETQTGGGGKGGGGGGSVQISYTYSAAMMLALTGGPVQAVPRVWINKEIKGLPDSGLSLLVGGYGQAPWSHLVANHPDEAVGYSGLAIACAARYDLGDDPSSPQLTFEVVGQRAISNGDALPGDVIHDLVCDRFEGLGLDPALIAGASNYAIWCAENAFTVSLLADSQKPARDWLKDVLDATVATVIDDDERIRIVPLGDQPVGAWQPDTTPVYDLTEHDVLSDPNVRRKQPQDLSNTLTLTYTSRERDYSSIPVKARDITHVNQYGEKAESKELACITRADMAIHVAESLKDRALYQLAEVELRLDERFILLQAADIITLTFGPHALDHFPLRVREVTIAPDGEITVLADEWPAGVASPAKIETQPADGYVPNYNVAPGDTHPPVVFEPPVSLASQPEIWVAASGGPNWGGAEAWVSLDDATYSRIGVITGATRHGILTAAYPLGPDPDATNVLSVDISASGGQLMPVTPAVRDLFESLCFVGTATGGELVAYQGAVLTGSGRYNLTNMRRGAYGTKRQAHAAGAQFARLDGAVMRYPYNTDLIGKTIYLKLRSYNKFGAHLQDLADVAALAYVVRGAPLGAVGGLVLESPFAGLVMAVRWNAYPGATHYNIELYAGGAMRKALSTVDTRFEVTVQQLVSWGIGRSVEVQVVAVAASGQSSEPAVLIATKAQCPAPTISVQDTSSSMIVTASQSSDAAYRATRICISQTQGFDPQAVTPYYDGPQTAYPSPTIDAGTWYVRATQYDQFGPDGLNWTTEVGIAISASADGVARVPDAAAITAPPGSPPPDGESFWAVYDLKTGKMAIWDKSQGAYRFAVTEDELDDRISDEIEQAIPPAIEAGWVGGKNLLPNSGAEVSADEWTVDVARPFVSATGTTLARAISTLETGERVLVDFDGSLLRDPRTNAVLVVRI